MNQHKDLILWNIRLRSATRRAHALRCCSGVSLSPPLLTYVARASPPKEISDTEIASTEFLASLTELYASPVPYKCSGKVLEPLTLLAKVGKQAIGVDFPVSADNAATDLKPLMDLCEPATFGRGKEHVLDPSYRNALVLPTTALGLVGPSFSLTPILDTIQRSLLNSQQQLEGKRIKAVFEKCNVYAKGGFFGPHADTPRGHGMFASLVLILPSHFTGGELIIRGKAPKAPNSNAGSDEMASMDSEEHSFGCDDATQLKWIAFVSNTEHEIKPVLDGFRVTVTYNLFLEDFILPAPLGATPDRPTADIPVYNILLRGFKNPDFWPEGKEIGIHCQNSYYVATDMRANGIISHLRGIDLWVYNSLKFLSTSETSNITFTMHFVVQPDAEISGEDATMTIALPANSNLARFEGDLHEYGDDSDFFLERGGRALSGPYGDKKQTGKEVWVVNQWTQNGYFSFMTYGNEPQMGCEYASIMFLINVPPFAMRFDKPNDS